MLRPAQILHILAAADSFFADIAPSRLPPISHTAYPSGRTHTPSASYNARNIHDSRPTTYSARFPGDPKPLDAPAGVVPADTPSFHSIRCAPHRTHTLTVSSSRLSLPLLPDLSHPFPNPA